MASERPSRRSNATGDPRNRSSASEPRSRSAADDPRYRSASNDPRRRGAVSEPLHCDAEDDLLRRSIASDPRGIDAVDDGLEELRRMSHDQDWLGRRAVPAPPPPSSRSFAPSSRSHSSSPWRCSFYDSLSNMRMAGLPSRPSACSDALVPDAAG